MIDRIPSRGVRLALKLAIAVALVALLLIAPIQEAEFVYTGF